MASIGGSGLLLAALRLLSWDVSPDPTVDTYQLLVRVVRPVHVACTVDGVPTTCLDRYDTLVDWRATVPCRPDGEELAPDRCGARAPWPVLEAGDVMFFQLLAVRPSGCASMTAWPPP